MKHFPGLGFAARNTDDFVVHIHATKSKLAPGLRPYRHAVANGVPLVMLSNAVYRAYRIPYGWIPQITRPTERAVAPPVLGDFRVP